MARVEGLPPLAGAPLADADLALPQPTSRLHIRTVETAQVLSLRYLPGGTDALRNVLATVGVPALPVPGQCIGTDPLALWRSPSECLLVAFESARSPNLPSALDGLPDAGAWIFDLTAGSQLLEVRGPDADALLLRLVDASALPAGIGHGTRLRLADIAVVAWRQEADSVHILADRSQQRSLAAWLMHAAQGLDDGDAQTRRTAGTGG